MWETVYRYLRRAALLSGSLSHTFFACISFLAGFLLEERITRHYSSSVGDGTFTDSLTRMEGPLWLPGLFCTFLCGCIIYFFSRSRTATLSWLLPALILAWNLLSWPSNGGSAWDTFFGTNCGSSECLYQLFVTSPFYACVAYSLGALTVRLFLKLKEIPNTGLSPD